MLHFTETQAWLIVVVTCMMFALVVWAVFIIIPNRNSTIRFLQDRNQTLEYWVTHIDLNKSPSPFILNFRGTDPEKNLQSLHDEHQWLNDQLRKCLINIEHCNDAIRNQKKENHESQ